MLPFAAEALSLLAVFPRRQRERPPAHRCEEQARVRIEDSGAYGCPCLTGPHVALATSPRFPRVLPVASGSAE